MSDSCASLKTIVRHLGTKIHSRSNVVAVFNLEELGEHAYCGRGNLMSGFSYDPEQFMKNNSMTFSILRLSNCFHALEWLAIKCCSCNLQRIKASNDHTYVDLPNASSNRISHFCTSNMRAVAGNRLKKNRIGKAELGTDSGGFGRWEMLKILHWKISYIYPKWLTLRSIICKYELNCPCAMGKYMCGATWAFT